MPVGVDVCDYCDYHAVVEWVRLLFVSLQRRCALEKVDGRTELQFLAARNFNFTPEFLENEIFCLAFLDKNCPTRRKVSHNLLTVW